MLACQISTKKMSTLSLIFYSLSVISVSPSLINTSVNRTIDLRTQLVKINSQIVFHKLGAEDRSEYVYTIDPDVKIYHIKFTNADGNQLFQVDNETNEIVVHYKNPFRTGEKVVLNVEEIHPYKIKPLHKKKYFTEPEPVWYEGNLYYYSVYETKGCNISYLLNGRYDVDRLPMFYANGLARYYISELTRRRSTKPVRFNFFAKEPLLNVWNLLRTIDISHYGYITVTEEVHLKNIGAHVHGPYKYSPNNWLYTHLPESAENIDMHDELGTGYNFLIREYGTYKTVQFKTRYSLLGGWQTKYTINYMVPTYEYISYVNTTYLVAMRIVDHVLNDAVINYFKTRILLPENAHYFHHDVPSIYKVDTGELSITHLTCFGRPTIIIEGADVAEGNIDVFFIKYNYDRINLLRVPFKLVLFYFIMLLAIIFIVRLTPYLSLSRKHGPSCK